MPQTLGIGLNLLLRILLPPRNPKVSRRQKRAQRVAQARVAAAMIEKEGQKAEVAGEVIADITRRARSHPLDIIETEGTVDLAAAIAHQAGEVAAVPEDLRDIAATTIEADRGANIGGIKVTAEMVEAEGIEMKGTEEMREDSIRQAVEAAVGRSRASFSHRTTTTRVATNIQLSRRRIQVHKGAIIINMGNLSQPANLKWSKLSPNHWISLIYLNLGMGMLPHQLINLISSPITNHQYYQSNPIISQGPSRHSSSVDQEDSSKQLLNLLHLHIPLDYNTLLPHQTTIIPIKISHFLKYNSSRRFRLIYLGHLSNLLLHKAQILNCRRLYHKGSKIKARHLFSNNSTSSNNKSTPLPFKITRCMPPHPSNKTLRSQR